MKLCIIGNSHVGSLKTAWDNHFPAKNGVKITFFAAPGYKLDGLKLDGHKLVPSKLSLRNSLRLTSGGQGEINLKEYDCFLIYGVKALSYFEDKNFHSSAATQQALDDHYGPTLSYQIANMIRKSVASNIYIGHVPMPSAPEKDNAEVEYSSNQYNNGVELANTRFFSLINAELIKQPGSTIAKSGCHTQFIYSTGSRALNNRVTPMEDTRHMNDKFGQVWLQSFLNEIQNQ